MSATASVARVSVTVNVDPTVAFEVFTQDIDRWWRRGVKFRHSGNSRGLLCLEPRVGGRLFESFETSGAEHVVQVGVVSMWDPPRKLIFSWRNANFAPDEQTEVEVGFSPTNSGTLVTVTHRGLTALPPDHPARHGLPDDQFIRMIGLWWGELMTAMREFIRTRP
jgi:uncharacterized protein YndB with AHSA1/START domain